MTGTDGTETIIMLGLALKCSAETDTIVALELTLVY